MRSSSAQLAAQYPTSGGTYIYGRERRGEWPGFLAGWGFVIGKTANCAAMALTFAAVNYFGVTRTANLTRVIVVFVLLVLAFVVVLGLVGVGSRNTDLGVGIFDKGWHGILQSAGLLFFAFAGYARIATMGKVVKNPNPWEQSLFQSPSGCWSARLPDLGRHPGTRVDQHRGRRVRRRYPGPPHHPSPPPHLLIPPLFPPLYRLFLLRHRGDRAVIGFIAIAATRFAAKGVLAGGGAAARAGDD